MNLETYVKFRIEKLLKDFKNEGRGDMTAEEANVFIADVCKEMQLYGYQCKEIRAVINKVANELEME